jgi:hypothetical protein
LGPQTKAQLTMVVGDPQFLTPAPSIDPAP